MNLENKTCELCQLANFRYICPKCNLRYCSVACYKGPKHIKCSEEFYRTCIQEELSSAQPGSQKDMKKIYDILKRIRETDAGVDCNFEDQLDSDDDEPYKEESYEDEEDLAARLRGVNLNDAEAVWEHLSAAEKEEFQKMVESGDIIKLVPNFTPWWIQQKASKIVEINSKTEENILCEPQVAQNIPTFSQICKKEPSPCVHYNLWNVLAAYTCVVRLFSGDHLKTPIESASHLVNLSSTLKYGTNFEDANDSVLSVETEAITTGNGVSFGSFYVESREQLEEDTRRIMATTKNKLIALSDILQLFQVSKNYLKNGKRELSDVQKIFGLSNGSVQLNRSKLSQFIKRLEFFLAFVNREFENI